MTSWIKTVLEQHGYEVSTAEVGALGQERLKTWRPAAIVTDLVLPDVDGVEHIRKLKELDPDVAVIVLSGQGDVPHQVFAAGLGELRLPRYGYGVPVFAAQDQLIDVLVGPHFHVVAAFQDAERQQIAAG